MQKRISSALSLPPEVAARQLAAMYRAATSAKMAAAIESAILANGLGVHLTKRGNCYLPK